MTEIRVTTGTGSHPKWEEKKDRIKKIAYLKKEILKAGAKKDAVAALIKCGEGLGLKKESFMPKGKKH